jgi:hypothetical protein
MMRRPACVLFLGIVVASASCARDRTLEVVNISGRRQAVMAFDRSLSDLYWIDSVDAGRAICWRAPEFARNETVVVVVTPVLSESEVTGVLARPKAGTDSVVLNRSWSFRIHAAPSGVRVDRAESSACRGS